MTATFDKTHSLLSHQSSSASSGVPHLFLFPGMGGYDPDLIQLGIACEEWVQATQLAFPHWTAVVRRPQFDFEVLLGDILRQINSHCPAGPVLLAGYSFGGIVAFAVAHRLGKAGRSVRFLGLLDIEAEPGVGIGARRRRMTPRQELAGFIAALRRGEGLSKLAYAASRILKEPQARPLTRLIAGLPRRLWSGKFASYLDRDLLFWHLVPLLREWATIGPTLPPLDAQTCLFRTEQHDSDAPWHLGWDRLCPNLRVVAVPGKHSTLLGQSLAAVREAFAEAVRHSLR